MSQKVRPVSNVALFPSSTPSDGFWPGEAAPFSRDTMDSLFEWAFRLAQEPTRLWRRYLRYNPRFVVGFARQLARHRLARRVS